MLTKEEVEILGMLRDLANKVSDLPELHHADTPETYRDIHDIQNRIMARAYIREQLSENKGGK